MIKALSRPAALALMVVAPLLWSMAGVVTRHIEHAGAFEMVFWRSVFAGAFVALAGYFLGHGGPWRTARTAGWTGLRSGAMWAVMFTAFVVALNLTTTANALFTMSIGPMLAAVAARIVLKEAVPPRTWIAAFAATAGLAWMFGGKISAQEPQHLAGMLVALLVPVAATANVVMLRAARAKIDLVPAVMIGAVMSAAIALPLALPFSASGRDLALLALLGCFQLGLPCMLYVIASRSLLAPELALLALIEVVLGPVWAWLGAGEVAAPATLSGGMVILAALAGNELAGLRQRAVATAPGYQRR
jgi:drug/metabolite transporter (DMT)-like permease